MTYGIAGNTSKEKLWAPAGRLVNWLWSEGLPFVLRRDVAEGLIERDLVHPRLCEETTLDDIAEAADVVISFGGDGTLLRTAHEVGVRETPILGVNIGRLGFLAAVEAGDVESAIRAIEAGQHAVDARTVLTAEIEGAPTLRPYWSLNDVVVAKSGTNNMITVVTRVDGYPVNHYWGDGLVIATPTGSTAYSLAAGGPLIAPDVRALVLTPLAPHTLTARPIVLPESCWIELEVETAGPDFIFAVDGESQKVDSGSRIVIRKADHVVRLVRLPGQDYFETVRHKLGWGRQS